MHFFNTYVLLDLLYILFICITHISLLNEKCKFIYTKRNSLQEGSWLSGQILAVYMRNFIITFNNPH